MDFGLFILYSTPAQNKLWCTARWGLTTGTPHQKSQNYRGTATYPLTKMIRIVTPVIAGNK